MLLQILVLAQTIRRSAFRREGDEHGELVIDETFSTKMISWVHHGFRAKGRKGHLGQVEAPYYRHF